MCNCEDSAETEVILRPLQIIYFILDEATYSPKSSAGKAFFYQTNIISLEYLSRWYCIVVLYFVTLIHMWESGSS